MEGIFVKYLLNSIDSGSNKKKLKSGKLLSGMSTVWEDTDGCAKQYIFGVAIYLMTLYHLHM